MTSRIGKPDTEADLQLRDCLDQPALTSFVMVAGAGWGRHRIRNINPVKVFSVTSRRLLAKIHLGQYVDKAFGV